MNDDDNDDLKYNSSVARAQSHNGRNKIIYLNTLLFFLKYKIDIQEVLRTAGMLDYFLDGAHAKAIAAHAKAIATKNIMFSMII